MATHSGHEGLVKVATDTVAEVTSWSIDESGDTIEDSELSDSAKTFLSGQTSWTASIEAHWDETDTAQNAMTSGAAVTLSLYPEGATAGAKYFTGAVIITSISRSGGSGATVTANFGAQGNGALSLAT